MSLARACARLKELLVLRSLHATDDRGRREALHPQTAQRGKTREIPMTLLFVSASSYFSVQLAALWFLQRWLQGHGTATPTYLHLSLA